MRRRKWLWVIGVLAALGAIAFGLDRWGPDRARLLSDDELRALAEDLPEPTADEFPVRVVRFDFWGNVVPAPGVSVFLRSNEGREEDPREFRRLLRDLPERPVWLAAASRLETDGEGVVWLPRRTDSVSLYCEDGGSVEWLNWNVYHGLPKAPPILVLRPPPRLVIRTVDGTGRPVPYVVCALDCYREGDAEREQLPILTGADGRRVISDLSGIVDYGDLGGRTLRGGARIGTREGTVRWPGWGETAELILTVPECGVVEAVPVPPEGCEPFETTVWIQGLDAEDGAVTNLQVQTFGNERVRAAVPLSPRVRVTWVQGKSVETAGPSERGEVVRVEVPLDSGIWIRGRLDVEFLGWESGGWAVIAAHWIKTCRVARDGAFSFHVSADRWEEMWDHQFGPGIGVSPAVPLFVRGIAPFRLAPGVDGTASPVVDLPVPMRRDLPHVVDVGVVTPVPLKMLVGGVITVDGVPPYAEIRARLEYLDESGDTARWRPSFVRPRQGDVGRFAFNAPDIGVKLRLVVDAEWNHVQPIDPIPVEPGQTDVRIELRSRKGR